MTSLVTCYRTRVFRYCDEHWEHIHKTFSFYLLDTQIIIDIFSFQNEVYNMFFDRLRNVVRLAGELELSDLWPVMDHDKCAIFFWCTVGTWSFQKTGTICRRMLCEISLESSNFGQIMNLTMLLDHFCVDQHLQQNRLSLQSVDELRRNLYSKEVWWGHM